MTNKVRICPSCRGSAKDSTGMLSCGPCAGYGEVVPMSETQAQHIWVSRIFPGLDLYGYEPTKMHVLELNRRVMVFREPEDLDNMPDGAA